MEQQKAIHLPATLWYIALLRKLVVTYLVQTLLAFRASWLFIEIFKRAKWSSATACYLHHC